MLTSIASFLSRMRRLNAYIVLGELVSNIVDLRYSHKKKHK